MNKFIIELIKGDDRKILGIFDTEEMALQNGTVFRNQYSRDLGLIACICAHVSECGQVDYSRYKIYNVWN